MRPSALTLRCWLAVSVLIALSLPQQCCSKQWKWLDGSGVLNIDGQYGQLGVPSQTNYPPSGGAGVSFFDADANAFWMFGGASDSRNDLWRYKIVDKTWAWMAGANVTAATGVYEQIGVPSNTSSPAGRVYCGRGYDASQKVLWIMGGSVIGGYGNDLWRYNLTDGMWTWMNGSSGINAGGTLGQKGVPSTANIPGGQLYGASWFLSDRQELWLFGGYGFVGAAKGYINNMWRYRVNDSTWTWMTGSGGVEGGAVYGQKGVADPANTPGVRYGSATWYDQAKRELWLFGGGRYILSTLNTYNDVWRYRLDDNTWTWMLGSAGEHTTNGGGSYGELGVQNSTNYPPARVFHSFWITSSGEFWTFGGLIAAGPTWSSGGVGYYNDLWKLNTGSLTWTWMDGNSTLDVAPALGAQDQFSPSNNPGSRAYPYVAYDNNTRTAWMFGGAAKIGESEGPLSLIVLPDLGLTNLFFAFREHGNAPSCQLCSAGSCVDDSALCASGTNCVNGFCVLTDGSPTSDVSLCESNYLSYSGHCCGTECPYCNDCSSGVCMPDIAHAEQKCPVISCVGKTGGWTQNATCSVCVADVMGQCFKGQCNTSPELYCTKCEANALNRPRCADPLCRLTCPVGVDASFYSTVPTVCSVSNEPCGSEGTCQAGGVCFTPSASVPVTPISEPTGSSNSADSPSTGLIVGVVIAVVIILCVTMLLAFLIWRYRRGRQHPHPGAIEMDNAITFRRIKASELRYGKQLGEGSFGAVFEGKYRGQAVAIKQLSSSAAADFFREANLMMSIPPHENLVQLYGICQQQNSLALAMELVEKGPLSTYLTKETRSIELTESDYRRICRGIASGMAVLAEQNIVHRDLAARNILLAADLTPKVSDFGFSRVVGEEGVGKTATVIGPVRWMAPEALNMEFSEKSDVWSYGCILIEIFAGTQPYPNLDVFSVAKMVRDEGLIPEIPAHTPQWARTIMEHCFQRDPQLRPTFKQLIEMVPPP